MQDERITVFVVAVGKRDSAEAYKDTDKRLGFKDKAIYPFFIRNVYGRYLNL